ncbi:hypothetical protein LCGC14_1865240 [marine sediment metagenome]|uniref:Uncharacterized protein n=1 Tax=marine sediment metagenome TaxID=412755 RepID=A0A0F9G6Q0_9ZZZZ
MGVNLLTQTTVVIKFKLLFYMEIHDPHANFIKIIKFMS